MNKNNCECNLQKKVSAKSIANSQSVLRKLAPKPTSKSKHEEAIIFHGGRLMTSLNISKNDNQPQTVLIATQESLGILVVEATSKLKISVNDTSFDMQLRVWAGLSSGKKIGLLGNANVHVDNKAQNVKIINAIDNTADSIFKKKINWGDFVNCTGSYCVGGFFSACNFSSLLCFACFVGCLIASIEDDD